MDPGEQRKQILICSREVTARSFPSPEQSSLILTDHLLRVLQRRRKGKGEQKMIDDGLK